MGRVREEKSRREKIREEKEWEERRCRCAREKVGKSRKTFVFPIICGSGGSKSRLAKAAGAEPCRQMRDEQMQAVVVRSTFPSQNVQNNQNITPCSDHLWKLRCRKSVRRCGLKHISKSKVEKTAGFRSTFGRSERGRRKGFCTKWAKREGFVAASTTTTTTLHYTPLCYNYIYNYNYNYTTLHYTTPITLHYTTPVTLHYTTFHFTTLHCTTLNYTILRYNYNYNYNYNYCTLHYNTRRYTALHHTPLNSTPRHSIPFHSTYNYIYIYITLHYATLHYTTLRCTTLHYTTLHYITLHPLHHHNSTVTTLHHNYNSTTLQLQLPLHYTTLHPAVVGEATDQVTTATIATNHSKKHNSNHLAVHQWIRSAIRDHNDQALL